ncbi:MAG: YggT family protein [Peptococcaceae bacterium]|nr:YggT family protein [Peptococcaceae bacterium]MBR2627207.1 YggT family protein [Peptococcaceae bacterium]
MITSTILLFLRMCVSVMNLLILVRCFLSFIPHNPYHPLLRYVYEITELVMEPCRKILPDALKYPLDVSPIVAMILIDIVYSVLVRIVYIIL